MRRYRAWRRTKLYTCLFVDGEGVKSSNEKEMKVRMERGDKRARRKLNTTWLTCINEIPCHEVLLLLMGVGIT